MWGASEALGEVVSLHHDQQPHPLNVVETTQKTGKPLSAALKPAWPWKNPLIQTVFVKRAYVVSVQTLLTSPHSSRKDVLHTQALYNRAADCSNFHIL